jgi:hypothetical protein
MPRKKRVPVPPDTDAEMLYASDNTCCVCREPRRSLQVHHIDDDPSNNNVTNLAVLCLDCHDKTQIHGGFGKKLTARVVIRCRNEWLKAVAARRAGKSAQPSPMRRASPPSRMSQEQARAQARHLRELYKEFLTGVKLLQSVATELSPSRTGGADVAAQLQRLQPRINEATTRIGNTLFEIRVEPGSDKVCDAFDAFQRTYHHFMGSFVPGQPVGAITRAFVIPPARERLDKRLLELEQAIRAHIRTVDRLT